MVSLEFRSQCGGPALAGGQDGGGGLLQVVRGAVFRAGQAVPGLDADELHIPGLAPDQGVGEVGNVANDGPPVLE